MMKLALMRTATGKEDQELPLLQRTRSLELTAPQIAAHHLFFYRTMTQHTSRLCKGYLTMKESDGVMHQMTWPPLDLFNTFLVTM